MDKVNPVDPKEAFSLFKEAIDRAVRERNIELLCGLLRNPTGYQEVRDYLADTIQALLTKRMSFPNRRPKQNLEENAQTVAHRVLQVKKEKGWKLRSVVDFVAKKSRRSPSTVWSAWTRFGPALVATDLLREKYDIDAIVDALMAKPRNTPGPYFGKLSAKESSLLKKLVQEAETLQDSLRRKKASRSK